MQGASILSAILLAPIALIVMILGLLEERRSGDKDLPPARQSGAAWTIKPDTKMIPSSVTGHDDEDALDFMGDEINRDFSGNPLKFKYKDRFGAITQREITNWREYPEHFEGFCSDACDTRTFRKDRVLEWLCGSGRLKHRL